MEDNFFEKKFDEYFNKVKNNFDDYTWILFEKPCGYSFLYPALRNSPINSLYQHLDHLWTTSNNQIWTVDGTFINRSDYRTIRSFISENQYKPISSKTFPLVYKIHFDTSNYSINHSHECNNIMDNNRKNI